MPASLITVLLLFFLAFVVLPFGMSYFEIPKVIVAEALIMLLLFFKIFDKKFSISKIKKEKIVVALVLFFLSALHLLFFRTETSFFGNVFRLQGIFLLWNLMIIYLFSPALPGQKLPLIAFAVLSAQLFFSVIVTFNSNGRAVGTLGEPNSLAATVVFMWPFVFLISRNKLMKVAAVAATLIIIFLSKSRSGAFAFAFQMAFLVINTKLKISVNKSMALVLTFILLSYVLPFWEVFPYESRLEVWQASFFAGFKEMIVGNGFGNLEMAIHKSANLLNLSIQRNYVDSAHNVFLDYWVQGGIAGLFALIAAIYFFLKKKLAQKNQLHLTLFIGLITCLSFNPVSTCVLVAFWWLLGQEEV